MSRTDDLSRKHKGAWAELRACAWLLAEGYEVFRNISPCGEVDIIAFKDGKYRKLDVKYNASRTESAITLTKEQVAIGVEVLRVRPDGSCNIEAGYVEGYSVGCFHCGKRFEERKRGQIYCSKECRIAEYARS